jgi:hypothetical protein
MPAAPALCRSLATLALSLPSQVVAITRNTLPQAPAARPRLDSDAALPEVCDGARADAEQLAQLCGSHGVGFGCGHSPEINHARWATSRAVTPAKRTGLQRGGLSPLVWLFAAEKLRGKWDRLRAHRHEDRGLGICH